MRAIPLFAALLFVAQAASGAGALPDLKEVDRVVVWQEGDVNHFPVFVTISDQKTLARVVTLIEGESGSWKATPDRGIGGYLRFVFMRSSAAVARIDLGHRILAIGARQNLQTREIGADIEHELAHLATWRTPAE
jgi:hypothetical protein